MVNQSLSERIASHSPTPYGQLLRQYLRPHWAAMLLLALLLFGNIRLQLWAPQIVRTFIDAATVGEAVRQLLWLAATALGVTLVQQELAVDAAYANCCSLLNHRLLPYTMGKWLILIHIGRGAVDRWRAIPNRRSGRR